MDRKAAAIGRMNRHHFFTWTLRHAVGALSIIVCVVLHYVFVRSALLIGVGNVLIG